MTEESQRYRDGIRSGAIECRCPIRPHMVTCYWAHAVNEIYRLEREDENV